MLKRFINVRETLVSESINGLLRSSQGGGLAKLAGGVELNVVVQKDWKRDRVALVSGGGAGHEPAHSGFVGQGMLAAAVSGPVFTAPDVDPILSAIVAVTGRAGCLLIVKNYPHDIRNFCLAASQARAAGLKVSIVIVSDDISARHGTSSHGIAGTVLVHKIAGHYADSGASLEEVARIASQSAQAIRSLALALRDCNAYDPDYSSRILEDEAEIGLGIHGERDAETIPLAPLDGLMHKMVTRLRKTVSQGPLVSMINTLGAVPNIEACAIAESFANSQLGAETRWIIGPAPVMTSLDMVGFSLSVLPYDKSFLDALLAPVESPFWPKLRQLGDVQYQESPLLPEIYSVPASRHIELERRLHAGLVSIISSERRLNTMESIVQEGQAGTALANIAHSVLEAFPSLPFAKIDVLFATLGRLLSKGQISFFSMILSILLTEAGTEPCWRDGLLKGLRALLNQPVVKKGERTMVDALIPAIECLGRRQTLQEAALAARHGANKTLEMDVGAGRAVGVAYSLLCRVVDPGAEAVARFLEGMAEVM